MDTAEGGEAQRSKRVKVLSQDEYDRMVAELAELRPLRATQEEHDRMEAELAELRPLRSAVVAMRGILSASPLVRIH